MRARVASIAVVIAALAIGLGLGQTGQVTIQFSTWEAGPLADYWPAKVQEFQRANPRVRIDLLVNPDQYEPTILRLIAANAAPDVMQLFEVTVPILAERGNLHDLNSLISLDRFDIEDFIGSTLSLARFRGGLYGLGSDVNPQIMYYNIDLFEQAGVPLPTAGWTWDDLVAAARAITRDTTGDGRLDRWGVGWWWLPSGAWWVPALIQIWNNGGDMYAADLSRTRLNEPAAIQALQRWSDLIHRDRVSPNASEIGGSNVNALFQQGRLGIYLDGTWNIASFENLPFRWDVAPIPAAPGVQRTTFLHTSYYSISRSTRNLEASWSWLQFIVDRDAQQWRSSNLRYLPTRQSVNVQAPFVRADRPPRNARLISDVLPSARMATVAPNNDRIIQVFERELTLVYLGEKTAQQAMTDAAREINNLLAR